MSLTSKLTTIAAAGGSGESGYILDVSPSQGGNAKFESFDIDSNGNVFFGGQVGNYLYFAKGTLDGTITAGRTVIENPNSGVSYQVREVHLTPSENYLAAGLTLYSTYGGERASFAKVDPSTLAVTDIEGYTTLLNGYRNTNSRAGRGMICKPTSDTDRWLSTTGWTGGNTGNYLMKYTTNGGGPLYTKNYTIYSTHYTRKIMTDSQGTYLYIGATTGPDTGAGGYGMMLGKVNQSDGSGVARSEAYSSSGGAYGPMQTQLSYSPGNMDQDSTHIYMVGHHGNNGSSGPDGMYVQKVQKSNLAVVWRHMIQLTTSGSPQDLQGSSIAVDANGNVFAASSNNGPDGFRPKLVKYNSSGVLQWVKGIGRTNSSHESAFQTMKVHDGSLYISGTTQDSSRRIGFFMKTSLDGPAAGVYGNYTIVDYTNYIQDNLTMPSYSTNTLSMSNDTLNASDRNITQSADTATTNLTSV